VTSSPFLSAKYTIVSFTGGATNASGGMRKRSIHSPWPQIFGAKHAKSLQMPKQFPLIGRYANGTDPISALAPVTHGLKIAKRSQFSSGGQMTSFRQLEANRRNARLSNGPVTEEGKRKSRRNAIRHGLTAATVINALEDADDYAAFEMAVTSDYDVRTAVERELVLRLASLLWRLRRATAIESGLFKIQAQHLLQFRQRRQAHQERQKIVDNVYRLALAAEENAQQDGGEHSACIKSDSPMDTHAARQRDDLTQSFVRLCNLPTYPLDRLSRYEATLWRQACQILFTLRCLNRCNSWKQRGLP
jgi:hypothetical protein